MTRMIAKNSMTETNAIIDGSICVSFLMILMMPTIRKVIPDKTVKIGPISGNSI